jgi:hypothetical protein
MGAYMLNRFLSALTLIVSPVLATAAQPAVWSVGTGKINGHQTIIRHLSALPTWVNQAKFPNLIAVSWSFKSPSGMPSPTDKAAMNDFEETFSAAVEKEHIGILTMVVTGNGVCEWQFYARSDEEFMGTLNKALAGKPRFPIELSLKPDPQWSAYSKFSKTK